MINNKHKLLVNIFLCISMILCLSAFSVIAKPTLNVNIHGLPEDIHKKVIDSLLIYKAQEEPKITEERIKYLYDSATDKIVADLSGLGYYNPTISSSLQEKNSVWYATYKIRLNQPTILRNIDIKVIGDGSAHINVKKINIPLKKGEIVLQEDYEKAKDILLAAVHSYGYLRASFLNPQLLVDREKSSAAVILVIDSGIRYRFGKVEFIDPPYNVNFLQKFVLWNEGDFYDIQKISKTQEDLVASDMFMRVHVVPKPKLNDEKDLTVPVEIRLRPKETNRYTGSLGVGTDTGVRVTVGWQHRRKNTDGHKVNVGSRFSKIRKHAYCNYTIPGNHPAYDKYLFSNNFLHDSIRDEYSKRGDFYFSKVNQYKKLNQQLGVRYLMEKFKFSKDEPTDKKKLVIPNGRWVFITHKSTKIDPNIWERGIRIELGVGAGLNAIVGSSNMLMSDVLVKGIQPLGNDIRIIVLGQAGSVFAKHFNDIPLSLRYFSGGDRSVRGFGYRTLGPTKRDMNGNIVVIGGEKMFLGTVELERRFIPNVSMAAFYDIGNSFNSWKEKFAAGVGVGMRVGTPLGSLRFDIAKPVKEVKKDKIRLHLTFGKDL